MKKKKIYVTALFLIGALLVSMTGCSSEPQGGNAESSFFENMEAADLDGNSLTSDIFAENKLTLVNVWNVGCTPCIEEIPALDKINKEFSDKGVSVKGLYYNFGEDPDEGEMKAIDEILTSADASYTHIVPSAEMYASEEMQSIRAFPTTYFVNAEGKIINTMEGARDYEGWKMIIEDALQEVENDA